VATTTNVQLTDEQRKQIAEALRLDVNAIPDSIGLVAVSPEAGEAMGLPKDMGSKFSPSLIIT
jgi:hypothetical protein